MPQLKIVDVQTELRDSVKEINKQIAQIIGAINVLAQKIESGNTPDIKDADDLKGQVNNLRADLVGHVETYNKHIIQQHGRANK